MRALLLQRANGLFVSSCGARCGRPFTWRIALAATCIAALAGGTLYRTAPRPETPRLTADVPPVASRAPTLPVSRPPTHVEDHLHARGADTNEWPSVRPSSIATVDRAPASPTPTAAAAATSPSEAFAEAMRWFEKGEYALADEALDRFQRAHPRDHRAEDAAYLRAVSRWRMHDHRGAEELARSYLVAWPDGFRRSEVEQIVRRASEAPPPSRTGSSDAQ